MDNYITLFFYVKFFNGEKNDFSSKLSLPMNNNLDFEFRWGVYNASATIRFELKILNLGNFPSISTYLCFLLNNLFYLLGVYLYMFTINFFFCEDFFKICEYLSAFKAIRYRS